MPSSRWFPAMVEILIPAGGIIGFNSATPPPGFTLYSAADGYYIVGAGGAYTAEGITNPVTPDITLGSDGGHTGVTDRYYWLDLVGTVSNNWIEDGTTKGLHDHLATLRYNPDAVNMSLVQATSNYTQIPENGVVFSDGKIYNMVLDSAVNDVDGFFRADSTKAKGLETRNVIETCSSDSMSHYHRKIEKSTTFSSVGGTYGYDVGTFAHDHTGFTLTGDVKQVLLKAYKAIQSLSGVHGSCIILFPDATIPPGWALCDGTNGTPDCTDRFLKGSATGTGQGTGDNILTASGTTSSFSHNHGDSDETYVAASLMKHIDDVVHDHTFSWSGTLTPKNYALNFIKYVGV